MKRWLIVLFLTFATFAVQGREVMLLAQDETTEKRLETISSELRCLVCQNESLAGSQAELAQDLRKEIRGMIRSGKSDNQIMEFMVARYGDFVRYRPPLKSSTLLLWFGPALLFIIALVALFLTLRRRNQTIRETPLSAEEQQRVERLLNNKASEP